jgi:DNA-3-methyladenine glycosylase II
MKHEVLTPRTIRRAENHLRTTDPVMATIIEQVGRCGLGRSKRNDAFIAIVEAIIWQQLSGKAARTIYERFLKLFPDGRPAPATILAMPDERMRAAGLSRGKVAYLRDLSTKVADGTVHLESLERLTDAEVIETMTQVKGIGRWSAEMFLMFRLQRADVLPVGDLGIVKAMRRHYRLRKAPTPERMLKIAEQWRPYRSVASWYLWATLD